MYVSFSLKRWKIPRGDFFIASSWWDGLFEVAIVNNLVSRAIGKLEENRWMSVQ